MKLIFVCPQHQAAFESADYRIAENNGVVTGPDGQKMLDAKVALTTPCPFCGEKHVFHASTLPCPFTGRQM